MSARRQAQFGGVCGECDKTIAEDDWIKPGEDGWVHDECGPDARLVVICPSCWTTKPCGCEDL